MIRVLNIIPALNYCGGIENYAMAYYRHVDKINMQFDFITHTSLECSFKKEIEEMGGNVYCFPEFKVSNFKKIFRMIISFFETHKEYKIIHCHMANAAFIYLPIAKKYGIKVRIVHSHNTKYADEYSHALRNKILVYLGMNFVTHKIACTSKAGDFLFGDNKYIIIKNAIDCKRFAYNKVIRDTMRKSYCVEDKIVLGNIARFVPVKNHVFMIELLRSLLCIDSRYMMCFVGDGPLMTKIKETASDLKEHMLFVGVHQNVEDYYNMFDVFILPSLYEGLGIVNIEAQCSGLPVIVSEAVPNDVKITDQICALPLDVDKWTDKVLSIIDCKKVRTSKINEISKAGYNIEIESKNLEKMYENIIREN